MWPSNIPRAKLQTGSAITWWPYTVTKGSSKEGQRLYPPHPRWLPANPIRFQKDIGHKYHIECTILQDPTYICSLAHLKNGQLVGIPFSHWYMLEKHKINLEIRKSIEIIFGIIFATFHPLKGPLLGLNWTQNLRLIHLSCVNCLCMILSSARIFVKLINIFINAQIS